VKTGGDIGIVVSPLVSGGGGGSVAGVVVVIGGESCSRSWPDHPCFRSLFSMRWDRVIAGDESSIRVAKVTAPSMDAGDGTAERYSILICCPDWMLESWAE
jgi:hypothetical protein